MQRFQTVSDPRLSVWQSVIAEASGEESAMTETATQIALQGGAAAPEEGDAYLCSLAFNLAEARLSGAQRRAATLEEEIRRYSDGDFGFARCILAYLSHMARPIAYRDWQRRGQQLDQYGVIRWRLPADAKVAMIGDWGTGQPDARAMLTEILRSHRPDALIHLGDVYYSGTPFECETHVRQVFADAFAATGRAIPVFSLPGNHCYYARGRGFYDVILDQMNLTDPTWRQEASYFCLQTADDAWQFLAMDTGQGDANPFQTYLAPRAPALRPSEVTWQTEKLERFAGSTILLSHHPLFTQSRRINGDGDCRWLNHHLLATFQSYFDRVAAWFWGHEHNLILFQDGLLGLAKGRLIGCAGFQEGGHDPYAPIEPTWANLVPYHAEMPRLTREGDYFYHGYAILDFARAHRDAPITATYYEFPSWEGAPPTNPVGRPIYQEQIAPRSGGN